jgi:hypothetical protein
MTKRLSLITALVLSASMSIGAAVPQVDRPLLPEGQESGRVKLNKDIKSIPFAKGLQKAQAKKAPQLAKKNGISIDEVLTVPQEIITEAPAGTIQQYSRSSYSFYFTWFGLSVGQVDGYISEVVFGDDGNVYIKNPITEYETDSYIKGTLKDGVVTVTLPQPIMEYDGDTYYADLQKIVIDWDKGSVDYTPADTQVLKFSYEDGVLTQLDGEDLYLSLADGEGDWQGFGDTNIVMTPFKDESLKDVNIEGSEYQFTYDDGGHFITVAKDNSNVYLKGVFEDVPDVWIKGDISGDKVSFKSQSLGTFSGTAAYFVPAKAEEVTEYYEAYDYYDTYTAYKPLDELVLTYDAANDIYTADEDFGFIAYSTAEIEAEYIEYTLASYINPVIKKQGDVSNAKPQAPSFYAFEDYSDDESTEYVFVFTLSKKSTDGDLLDSSKLFYNILLDGEVQTFEKDMYDVAEDITDIPFGYTTEYDFYEYSGLTMISIYSEGFDTIGVQTVYRPEEGKEILSDVLEYSIEKDEATIIGESTGINNIAVDKSVKSEVYYDLTGRRVANPENGLFIKKVTYNDNTVKVSKIAK